MNNLQFNKTCKFMYVKYLEMHSKMYNLLNDNTCRCVCDFCQRLPTLMPGIETKSVKFDLVCNMNQVCETSDFLTVLVSLKLQKCSWMVWKMQFPIYHRLFCHDDLIC